MLLVVYSVDTSVATMGFCVPVYFASLPASRPVWTKRSKICPFTPERIPIAEPLNANLKQGCCEICPIRTTLGVVFSFSRPLSFCFYVSTLRDFSDQFVLDFRFVLFLFHSTRGRPCISAIFLVLTRARIFCDFPARKYCFYCEINGVCLVVSRRHLVLRGREELFFGDLFLHCFTPLLSTLILRSSLATFVRLKMELWSSQLEQYPKCSGTPPFSHFSQKNKKKMDNVWPFAGKSKTS